MAHYLDDIQRQEIDDAASSWLWRTEWPTWLLIGTIYACWFCVAFYSRRLGELVAIPLLAVLSAWYMSLQHELLHRHPTRIAAFNAIFGYAPLAVWFPYDVYRRSHLQHHRDNDVTIPSI